VTVVMTMIAKKIRVLIVDDSILFRQTLSRMLSENLSLEVVGQAGDPFEARDKILSLRPDVMTLDVEMPKMNGIEFLQKLIPQYPLPTVIISSAPIAAFDALDAGAVDYIKKPLIKTPADMRNFANEMVEKVKAAAQAKVLQPGIRRPAPPAARPAFSGNNLSAAGRLIALGSSTGGTDALQVVLTKVPANSPPIVMVQHMPPVFTRMFAERLDTLCAIKVKEAQNGDKLEQGTAYLAPGDFQMKVQKNMGGLSLLIQKGEKVSGHCPSVDVLFHSVADVVGRNAIGAIMTGMGSDGAKGLLAMRQKGAYTIGQDKDSCVVYGMPMVAYNIGACDVQVSLDKICDTIFNRLARS
jgi:two-component system chemotaxis response regulator CheB